MRFSVRHETIYRYSAPVRLGAQLLRLTPRRDALRRVESDLVIEPAPSRRAERTDRFGNLLTEAEFDGETDILRIESRLRLDTRPPAPLATAPPLPWTDAPAQADYLPDAPIDPTVRAFAESLARAAGGSALDFFDLLNRTLFERTDRRIRLEGDAKSAAETLASATGACRDLAILFIEASRSQGAPARFVSGYQAEA